MGLFADAGLLVHSFLTSCLQVWSLFPCFCKPPWCSSSDDTSSHGLSHWQQFRRKRIVFFFPNVSGLLKKRFFVFFFLWGVVEEKKDRKSWVLQHRLPCRNCICPFHKSDISLMPSINSEQYLLSAAVFLIACATCLGAAGI